MDHLDPQMEGGNEGEVDVIAVDHVKALGKSCDEMELLRLKAACDKYISECRTCQLHGALHV